MKFVKINYAANKEGISGEIIVPISAIQCVDEIGPDAEYSSVVWVSLGDNDSVYFYIFMNIDEAYEELKKEYPCLF